MTLVRAVAGTVLLDNFPQKYGQVTLTFLSKLRVVEYPGVDYPCKLQANKVSAG